MSRSTVKHAFSVVAAAFFAAVLTACALWDSGGPEATADPSADEVSANVPFPTAEPAVYRAELVVSTRLGGTTSERRYAAAKKDGRQLITYDAGSPKARSSLRTADEKIYLIDHAARTYRRLPAEAVPDEDDALRRFLTTRWLTDKRRAAFSEIGREKGRTKYLVRPEGAGDAEVIVYVDDELKLPVRQEFYSLAGGERKLTMTVEVKEFETEAGDELFELPEGYGEVD